MGKRNFSTNVERQIFEKTLEIGTALSTCRNEDVGLYSGAIGFTLFYSKLYELTKDIFFLKECHRLVEKSIDLLSQQNNGYTFCNGLAGMLWGFKHLKCRGLIDFDESDFFEEIDDEIYDQSLAELRQGRYDFMHGGSGAALYALNRLPDKKAMSFLKEVVHQLDSTKFTDIHGSKWEDRFNSKINGKLLFDLGLSHGIPSIVNILLRIHQKGIMRRETFDLAESALRWILSCKLHEGNNLSIYPSRIATGANPTASRLAWCYGDLGIAWTLFQAATVFKNDYYFSEAIDTLNFCLKRRDPLQNLNLDAGFCHGTAGIAYFFKRFDEQTQVSGCSDAYRFWISETIKLAKFHDGLAGYKFYHQPTQNWTNQFSLLEGLCGVGLVLASHSTCQTNWDECFLISF